MNATPKKKATILLVNPTFTAYAHGWPPLGLAYLASALRKAGHEVHIFDPTPTRPDLKVNMSPDLIGISILSPMRHAALEIAERLRTQTSAPIVVGGPDVTSCWPALIQSPAVDYAVIGEGERTLVEMANCVAAGEMPVGIAGTVSKYRAEPVIHAPRGLLEDLDEIPIPSRELFDMNWYGRQVVIRGTTFHSTTVMWARGCPWKCLFCDSRHTWTRKYRAQSIGRMIEELRSVRQQYGISYFQFLDDTFPVQRTLTMEFCARIARELPDVRWSCQARVTGLDEELVSAMKAGGCIQMEFGVESGSQRILDFLNKGFKIDQVVETFALCRRQGVRTFANFLVGTPGESWEDVESTFRLCKEIRPDVGDLWVTTPYPGTDLYEHCIKHQLLSPDFTLGRLHHGHELGSRYYIKSQLTQDDINRALQRFYSDPSLAKGSLCS